jgi:hypothetical protein
MRRLTIIKVGFCITGLIASLAAVRSEEMTQELFSKLVARPGDTNQLRSELRHVPFFTNAICTVVMKFEDGRVSNEECKESVRTVDGNYIVFDLDSQFYHQVIHAVVGYDEKAKSIRVWGLYGDVLTSAIVAIDLEKKSTASTASFAGGFMELSLGSFSDTESSDRTWVYKEGALFCTRDIKTRPVR